jgi:hypothetical protein
MSSTPADPDDHLPLTVATDKSAPAGDVLPVLARLLRRLRDRLEAAAQQQADRERPPAGGKGK